MASGRGGLPWFHRLWWLGCAGLAACLVAARELHYLRLDWPLPVARTFDALMHLALHSVIVGSITLPVQFIAGLALVLAFAIRPRWFRVPGDGRWESRPWVHSVIWTELALNNFFLDLNPWVARASLASVILLPVRSLGHPVWSPALTGAFFVLWIVLSPTVTDAMAVGLWSALFLAVAGAAATRVGGRDRLWLGVSASVLCQLAAAALPLALPLHRGVKIADGMAYGFCERDEDGRIFAVVPGSGWGPNAFLSGHLDEISPASLSVERRLYPFDRSLRGRAIAPLCLPDAIQLAMAQTLIGAKLQWENVMELSADGSRRVRRSLFGADMGQTLFWDRERDAVFYASEWSNRIFRLDRATGHVNREVGRSFIPTNQNHWFFFRMRFPGSLALTNAIDPSRRTFVAGHWTTGSTAYEIDLDTLQLRSRIEAHHGGTSQVSIDGAYHRVLLSSPWGLDVFDLETGLPLARLRTGFGCRTAVVDTANDLIYVPTTVEGRIRVLDRASLRRRGVIDIGYGPRNAFFSDRASALLATSSSAYYYWKSDDLAKDFAPASSR